MSVVADTADFTTFHPNLSRTDLYDWFQKRLNRPPEAYDFYKQAREFYQLGSYSRSIVCLREYITLPGAATPGRHLLAYCHLNLGEKEKALREFKKCVKEGYQEDWQLVVELTIELESKRREEAATSASSDPHFAADSQSPSQIFT
ncbi:hypothetical protein HDU85_001100 [Gaertneriomyces sp. JEL0708]|nr:hypothetical protein HDU85_001100 [Gaertneriomyces sp. JEL0708]